MNKIIVLLLLFGLMPGVFARASLTVPVSGRNPREPGWVAWRDGGDQVVVDFEFADRSILATGERDQLEHNVLGDLLEIFIVAPEERCYWEIFVTPRSRQSVYRWKFKDHRKLDRELLGTADLRVEIRLKPVADGWGGQVLIPRKMLEQYGDPLRFDGSWKIFFARQNYTGTVDKAHRELSSYPKLDQANFHRIDAYLPMRQSGEKKNEKTIQ